MVIVSTRKAKRFPFLLFFECKQRENNKNKEAKMRGERDHTKSMPKNRQKKRDLYIRSASLSVTRNIQIAFRTRRIYKYTTTTHIFLSQRKKRAIGTGCYHYQCGSISPMQLMDFFPPFFLSRNASF